jgi:hypothetical protein
MEKWKVIEDFKKYEVSNLGNIRNIKSKKILKPKLQNGYLCISLSDGNNKIRRRSIHRLVGFAFTDNTHNKPIINHINGNKIDNNSDNLEWVTQKENIEHALENNMINFYKCPITQMDLDNNIIRLFNSIKEIEDEFEYDRSLIIRVCKGKGKTAYGFKWAYTNNKEDISNSDVIGKSFQEYNNYVITKDGKIYSKKTKKYLKPIINKNGHCYVTFSKDGKKKNFYIHVLVANLYITNPHNYSIAIHKNGDKTNNKKENLEWVKFFNHSCKSS